MAASLTLVKSGDLISAELFNLMVQKIAELQAGQGQTPSGSVIVPSVFGQTLHDATSILGQASFRLNMGITIDAFGNTLDPDLPEVQDRVVLTQTPNAGLYALPGSAVDLVLSAKIEGGSSGPKVKIASFSHPKVHIKEDLVIIGEGFDPDRYENEVTFDGIPAGTPSIQSTTSSLFIFVPEGIPNAPTQPDQEREVQVRVKTPYGSASRGLIILAPLAGEYPSITNLANAAGLPATTFMVGDTILINGTNFSIKESENKVNFNETSAELVAGQPHSTTRLFIKAPKLPGHTSAPVVGANVVVTTLVAGTERKSNAVGVSLVRS